MDATAKIQQGECKEVVPRSSSGFVKRAMRLVSSYSYRVPYCVPYWNAKTYHALLRCISRGHVIEGPDREPLAKRLATFLSVPDVILCGSGRVAIELALRALNVTMGAEVVVPTFCCISIIPPILAVGAVPVFADVGDQLTLTPETVAAVLSPRTRAVIVPHLFGNCADIEGILSLCHSRHIRVIDDAAQAVGATLAGQSLGTFGDAGLMSFGNGKVCFGTGGGVLIAKDPEVIERARQVPLTPSAARAALHTALSVTLWRRWRRWSLPVKIITARTMGTDGKVQAYSRMAMSNLDAAVTSTLLDTLADNLRARRQRVAAYAELLGQETGIQLIPHHPGSACLTQVMVVNSDSAETAPITRIVNMLRASGYEVNTSYTPLHLQPAYQCYAITPLVNAERMWNRAIELPCEPSVSLQDVEQIAALVRMALTQS